MARKGILTTNLTPSAPVEQPTRPRMMPQSAVGALQSSLSKLQENAVQDIDPGLIDDAGFEDRLGLDGPAQIQLKESLKTYGQQVPVLLRPHPTARGRFEIVYGRRRLQALRDLGMPVKAMVRQLDDHALMMAQGQENTARQDLSFVEKASFAAQLLDAGYDRPTIAAALSIDLPMVSRMLKVGTAFDLPFLRSVGRAPSIGRERWMALVDAFANPEAKERAYSRINSVDFPPLSSDDRFEAVLQSALNKTAKTPAPSTVEKSAILDETGATIGVLKASAKGLNLSITAKDGKGFEQWFAGNAETLLRELHARWREETTE